MTIVHDGIGNMYPNPLKLRYDLDALSCMILNSF